MWRSILTLISLLAVSSNAQKSDTFPSIFIGNWTIIGTMTMGHWVTLSQSDSNQKILISQNSIQFFKNDTLTSSSDSCILVPNDPNYIWLCVNCYSFPNVLRVSNDTLEAVAPSPGSYSFFYIASNTSIRNQKKVIISEYIGRKSTYIFNLKGQKVTKLETSSRIKVIENNSLKTNINRYH